MEFRPYYLAAKWKAMGHNVTIVAADQSHLRQASIEICDNFFACENVAGIDYIWLKTTRYSGNGVNRALNMFSFVRRLFQWRKWLKFSPDVVIASSTYPLDIFPAKRIAKKFSSRLVFELHDLWPLSPIELGGMSPGNPFIKLLQYAENYVCKNVDAVVSMLPCVIDHLVEHGLERDKFFYIPNGVVVDDWLNCEEKVPEEIRHRLLEIRKSGKRVIAYAGAHGVANALKSFAEASVLLRDSSIHFVTFGGGPELESLIRMSKGFPNFSTFGPISKKCIPDALSLSDFLFIGLQRQPLFRFGVSPNKLMDYMMAAKPIVCAISSGNDIVSDAKCGITCEPESPAAIASAIRVLLNCSESELVEMGRSGKQYVCSHHDYNHLAVEFLKVISFQGDLK